MSGQRSFGFGERTKPKPPRRQPPPVRRPEFTVDKFPPNGTRLRDMTRMVDRVWGTAAAYHVDLQGGLAWLISQWDDRATEDQWREALAIVETYDMKPTTRTMRRSVQWAISKVLAWVVGRDEATAARARAVALRLPDAGFAPPPALLDLLDAIRNNEGAHDRASNNRRDASGDQRPVAL